MKKRTREYEISLCTLKEHQRFLTFAIVSKGSDWGPIIVVYEKHFEWWWKIGYTCIQKKILQMFLDI